MREEDLHTDLENKLRKKIGINTKKPLRQPVLNEGQEGGTLCESSGKYLMLNGDDCPCWQYPFGWAEGCLYGWYWQPSPCWSPLCGCISG